MAPTLFQHSNALLISEKGHPMQEWHDKLVGNGCQRCIVYEKNDLDIPKFNHDDKHKVVKNWFHENFKGTTFQFIVSNTTNFFFYHVVAFDYLIPVVTTQWITQCLDKSKLLKTLNYSPDGRHILMGATFYISRSKNGFTSAEIKLYTEIIIAMGGTVTNNLSALNTHFIAPNSKDPLMLKLLESSKLNLKLVYPSWLLSCFKSLKLQDESRFQITLQQNNSETDSDDESEKINDLWNTVEEQNIDSIHHNTHIFQNLKLAIDLNIIIPEKPYNILIQFINHWGAKFKPYINAEQLNNENLDCLISNSIKSKDVEICQQKGIMVGNLIWLFNMWSMNCFQPSYDKIIWKPFNSKIFKQDQLNITYSNYFGHERTYIQKLAELLGGTSTTTLTKKNTHLLTKLAIGKKYEVGMKWGPHFQIINHLWLEDCLCKNEIIDCNLNKYKNFDINNLQGLNQMKWENEFKVAVTASLARNGNHPIRANTSRSITSSRTNSLTKSQTEKFKESLNQANANIFALKDNSNFDSSEDEETDIEKSSTIKLNKKKVNRVLSTQPHFAKKHDSIGIKSSFSITRTSSNISNGSNSTRANVRKVIKKDTESHADTAVHNKHTHADTTINDSHPHADTTITDSHPHANTTINDTVDAVGTDDEYEQLFGNLSQNDTLQKVENNTISDSIGTNNSINDNFSSLQTPVASRQTSLIKPVENESQSSRFITPLSQRVIKEFDHEEDDEQENDNSTSKKIDKDAETTNQSNLTDSIYSRKRAARSKAEKRLHSNIELINVFEQNKHSKKMVNLFPEEIAALQKRKKSEIESRQIILRMCPATMQTDEFLKELRHKFHIWANVTGCFEKMDELDNEKLKLCGINIIQDFKDDKRLNCIIAPKIMRTAKFLSSLSFTPLKYVLNAEFIEDVLKKIDNGTLYRANIDYSQYKIDKFDYTLLEKTKLHEKLFERCQIRQINLSSDIPGGYELISDILYQHGIEEINKISSRNTTLLENEIKPKHRQHEDDIFNCIIVVSPKASVTKLKKLWISEHGKNSKLLIVNWDWCVNSIFKLDCNFKDRQNIKFQS